MSFEDQSASGSEGICDIFAEFIEQTYVDDETDLVNDELPFGSLQFTKRVVGVG
jgi:hypothetical protein